MVLEGGATASIPVTLHELLLARLDLLPSRQKALAQVCAVVGREFPLALLVPVTGSEAAELRRELAGLVEAGLLQEERKGTGELGYQFRHALFQEAAYQSLPRGERRQHHRHIARVLKEHFSTLGEARPEVLAHHYTEAGEPLAAIPYWSRAGSVATERLAIPEAVEHFTRALELRRGLPAASSDPNEELQVLTSLGFALGVMRGFDSPEVERMYARAWELLQRMGEVSLLLGSCVLNIFAYHQVRAEFRRCNDLAELMVRQGERQRSPEVLALGHMMTSVTLIFAQPLAMARVGEEHPGLGPGRAGTASRGYSPRAAGGRPLAVPGAPVYGDLRSWRARGYPPEAGAAPRGTEGGAGRAGPGKGNGRAWLRGRATSPARRAVARHGAGARSTI